MPAFKEFFLDAPEIEPLIPARQEIPTRELGPTSTRVHAVITDDLGCDSRIADARVRFTNTITEDDQIDHGHAHFDSEDVGTGTYSGLDTFEWSLIDDGREDTATIIEGLTAANGTFAADYEADEIGLSELVTASVTRDQTAAAPEVTGEDEEAQLRIRIPGLVKIDHEAISADRADAGVCPHNPAADWLTAPSLARLGVVTETYFGLTERKLSLNDGSLPFGGFIENARDLETGTPGGRDARCHRSHRLGIDIDLNSFHGAGDPGGTALLRCRGERIPTCDARDRRVEELKQICDIGTFEIEVGDSEENEEILLICAVDHVFEREDGDRITSEGIHYRFPN